VTALGSRLSALRFGLVCLRGNWIIREAPEGQESHPPGDRIHEKRPKVTGNTALQPLQSRKYALICAIPCRYSGCDTADSDAANAMVAARRPLLKEAPLLTP
jgi:hypothetical protein